MSPNIIDSLKFSLKEREPPLDQLFIEKYVEARVADGVDKAEAERKAHSYVWGMNSVGRTRGFQSRQHVEHYLRMCLEQSRR